MTGAASLSRSGPEHAAAASDRELCPPAAEWLPSRPAELSASIPLTPPGKGGHGLHSSTRPPPFTARESRATMTPRQPRPLSARRVRQLPARISEATHRSATLGEMVTVDSEQV